MVKMVLTAIVLILMSTWSVAGDTGQLDFRRLAAEADLVAIGSTPKVASEWASDGDVATLGVTSATMVEWMFAFDITEVLRGKAPEAARIEVLAVQPRSRDDAQSPLVQPGSSYLVFLKKPSESRSSLWQAFVCFSGRDKPCVGMIRRQISEPEQADAH